MTNDDKINIAILIAALIFAALVFPAGSRMAEDANQWHSIQGTVR